jgi:hypothetical protein
VPGSGATIFQLLSCRVHIRYEDPALQHTFRYLVERARQSFEPRKSLTYEVRGTGPYDILEEGDALDRVLTRADVLHVVYCRVYRRVLERFVIAGWVALHAALATINGRRTIILGHKGAGKTTLAARLLFAGHAVEGDEMALVRNGLALALPRAFHLKPDIGRFVPEVAGIVGDLPKVFSGPVEIAALEPSACGFDWTIAVAAVNRVVWITPNHGGGTELKPRSSFATIRRIIECSLALGEPREALVGAAASLGCAGGQELVMGNPHDAVHLLEAIEEPACGSIDRPL